MLDLNITKTIKKRNKNKFFSLFFLFSLLLLCGCSNDEFKYPKSIYKDFIKVVKDHFGWIKDDSVWGEEDDDHKWNDNVLTPILSNDIQSYFDGNNYKTNLNNEKNWSSLYWFPLIKISGDHSNGTYDLNINSAHLISIGKYFDPSYDSLKSKLKVPYDGIKFPTSNDPSAHFFIQFCLNNKSSSPNINEIYRITYDATISDAATPIIDSNLTISNVESYKIIGQMDTNVSDDGKKDIIQNMQNDPHFSKMLQKSFSTKSDLLKNVDKLKVIGYSLLDKDSDKSNVTYDETWNEISNTSAFIRSSQDYMEQHKFIDNTKYYWFNDCSLKEIYVTLPDPDYSDVQAFFSFTVLWNSSNNKINRGVASPNPGFTIQQINNCSLIWNK